MSEFTPCRTRDAVAMFNVPESGCGDGRPLVFVHGFGCDQHMWRLVAPKFHGDFRVVTFDLAGAGGSSRESYDVRRHGTLGGYADDVIEICASLELRDVVLVGHSVSAIIGALAVTRDPSRFAKLVMVGPSPCYLDDVEEGYVGGFTEDDIAGLLEALESNYLGWSAQMAPVIAGRPDDPSYAHELAASFCRMDPAIAASFARVTFLSDHRADLPAVTVPTLIIQSRIDAIASPAVGAYVHAAIAGSTLVELDTSGHCPHLTAPDETAAAIADFVRPS